MESAVHNTLATWEAFYIIVGSCAGALTGLQFVVMAMIGGSSRNPASSPEIAAFGTPTVLHFCAALLVSCLLSAPWTSMSGVALSLTVSGLAGVVYALIVIRRAGRSQRYRPQLEDWIWHAALPLIAYAVLTVAGMLLTRHTYGALAAVAAASLGLVFIGIHNAWDTITYIAIDAASASKAAKKTEP